ncbi:MAG: AraC family transcriptional regulator [Anaerocolumna sp.]
MSKQVILNNQVRKQRFIPLSEEEKLYKKLYLDEPTIYDFHMDKQQFHNWKEFVDIYSNENQTKTIMPNIAPTPMEEEFLENNWFYREDMDACLIVNARYCPPFLHHLKFIKIVYVLSGECIFYTKGGGEQVLKTGNFMIVPPNVEQTVFAGHDEDIVINILIRSSTFENAFSSLLLESEELAKFFWKVLYERGESSVVWFRCNSDITLDKFVLDMWEEHENHTIKSNFLLVSYAMVFLAYALRYYPKEMESIQETRLNREQLPVIIQYIHANYNNINLTSLAEHFHKSKSYLCRYIKQETGYSFMHLLKEVRMKQAAQMLKDSQCSVEEIMLSVGYTDISYFYKAFKEYFGMTPVTYRKQGNIPYL